MTTLFYKIPPHLPFPKGGTSGVKVALYILIVLKNVAEGRGRNFAIN
jgi:hypothetical protein